MKSTPGRWVKSKSSFCFIAASFSWGLLTIHLLINLSSECLICLVYSATALHSGRGEPRRGVPAQEGAPRFAARPSGLGSLLADLPGMLVQEFHPAAGMIALTDVVKDLLVDRVGATFEQ